MEGGTRYADQKLVGLERKGPSDIVLFVQRDAMQALTSGEEDE